MRSWRHAWLTLVLVTASVVGSGAAWAMQCAPYARDISGINLHGSAWTWWQAADGQYGLGNRPQIGAALVFKKSRTMPSGHVAVVTGIVNARAITVDHANWVSRGVLRGSVEKDVEIVDESPNNDWSQVRVWYAPTREFGTKIYPVYGFIYPASQGKSVPSS